MSFASINSVETNIRREKMCAPHMFAFSPALEHWSAAHSKIIEWVTRTNVTLLGLLALLLLLDDGDGDEDRVAAAIDDGIDGDDEGGIEEEEDELRCWLMAAFNFKER